jgi:hypothetical protein
MTTSPLFASSIAAWIVGYSVGTCLVAAVVLGTAASVRIIAEKTAFFIFPRYLTYFSGTFLFYRLP